jgi:geranylgeranyl diphosphate synthase type I
MLRALEIFERTNVHLTIGQHLDIGFERRGDVSSADYLAMIAGKTGALTVACCEIGAVLGGGSDAHIHAAGEFGRYLGLAFQLQDDVLGVWGDAALTGKDSSDIAHRKKTLPLLYAAEQDARVRTLYFAPEALNSDQIQTLRAYVDATDARAHTEAAAAAAFAQGIEALDELPESAARTLLQTLAESLLGRSH